MQLDQREARKRRCRDSSRGVITLGFEVDVISPFLVALYAQNRYDEAFEIGQYATSCTVQNKLGQIDRRSRIGK